MIAEEWQAKLELSRNDEHAVLLLDVIHRYEPPVCRTALSNCIDQARTDRVFGDIDTLQRDEVHRLLDTMVLPTQMPSELAKPFPIYYRLLHSLAKFPYIRGLLHVVLAHHEDREPADFSQDRKYHDLRALQTVLGEAYRDVGESAVFLSISELSKLVDTRSSPGVSSSETDRASENTVEQARRRAFELLRSERTLGDRKRDPGTSAGQGIKTGGKHFDRSRAPSLLTGLGLDWNDPSLPNGQTAGREGTSPVNGRFFDRRSSKLNEPSDPVGTPIRIPFENPYSGRVSLQRQERVNLTKLQNDSVVRGTDYHRLTPRVRAQAIAALHQAGDQPFVFGVLIASLGLPINRLGRTIVNTGLPCGSRPHYDPNGGVIQYRILTGAVPAGDGYNRIMMLKLPEPLPRLIDRMIRKQQKTASARSEAIKPLQPAIYAARRCLQRCFHDHPGPPVTLRALGSGALEMLMPICSDEVEALLFTGNPGNYHAAAEAYRSSEIPKLNRIFSTVCETLAAEVADVDPYAKRAQEMLRSPKNSIKEEYSVGTRRNEPALSWKRLFHDIRRDARGAAREVGFAPPHSRERIEWLTSVYQFAAAYAYLGWSLATCARPTSWRTRIVIAEEEMFISDKSTKSLMERRVVPVPPIVKSQIAAAENLLEELLLTIEQSDGRKVRDSRGTRRSGLPPWMYIDCYEIHVTDLTMQHLRLWSQARGYPLHQWAVNVARSSGIVMLRKYLPTAVLDAQTGHARGSRDASSTWSGLTRPALFCALGEGVDHLLKEVGYQKLEVGGYV
mgnify:CR=1 FL=1